MKLIIMDAMAIILTFGISWWIIFYICLPFGIEKAEDVETGNDPGAPKKHDLYMKIAVTTILSGMFTFIWWYLVPNIMHPGFFR